MTAAPRRVKAHLTLRSNLAVSLRLKFPKASLVEKKKRKFKKKKGQCGRDIHRQSDSHHIKTRAKVTKRHVCEYVIHFGDNNNLD